MRFILTLILLPLATYIVVINAKLYHHPMFKSAEAGVVNLDLKAQLCHLKAEMDDGAANEMQRVFPEGFVFMNAMYGLAICNYLAHSGGYMAPNINEHRLELKKINEALHSSDAKRIFNENLPLRYGAFYNGWVTYFEGKRLSIENPKALDSIQVKAFQASCHRIAQAYESSGTPWLESYHLNTWPADNILCVAALKLHDNLFPPKYESLVTNWLKKMEKTIDPKTGLIPHSVNMDGFTLEGPRGSSQALMLTFLPLIDKDFAQKQFQLFKNQFVDDPFKLVAIREYPFGTDGNGDVDSGPVICGLGGAANIVGIAAFQQNGDEIESYQLRNEVEGLSFSMNFQGKKSSFFGAVPMADAFLAWVNSFQTQSDENTEMAVKWWRFHIYSAMLLLGFFLLYRYLTKSNKSG